MIPSNDEYTSFDYFFAKVLKFTTPIKIANTSIVTHVKGLYDYVSQMDNWDIIDIPGYFDFGPMGKYDESANISFNIFVNMNRAGIISNYVYSITYENFNLKEIKLGGYDEQREISWIQLDRT